MKNSKTKINQFKKTLSVLQDFDAKKGDNPDWNIIAGNIFQNIAEEKPVRLITFTCSTINPKYLFNQKEPEKYVSLNPKGNNLETDLTVLKKIHSSLIKIMPTKLIILIGNTDPFYIYSQEWSIYSKLNEKTLWKRFAKRWSLYQKNLEKWLSLNAPKLESEIISWYELEREWEQKTKTDFRELFQETYGNIDSYFSKKDLEWEFEKLKNSFGPKKYFYNLKKPGDKILRNWAERKFAEYAVQGLWIKQIWPTAILIQNEKPTNLRYKMYQPLINKIYQTRLPNIYPFGIDNLGFQ